MLWLFVCVSSLQALREKCPCVTLCLSHNTWQQALQTVGAQQTFDTWRLSELFCLWEVSRRGCPGRALFPECWITTSLESGQSSPASSVSSPGAGHDCLSSVTPYSFWDNTTQRMVFDLYLFTDSWYRAVLGSYCQAPWQCKNPATLKSWRNLWIIVSWLHACLMPLISLPPSIKNDKNICKQNGEVWDC